MQDLDLRYYLAILIRRLPLFAMVAAAVLTIGMSIAMLLPPVFVASSKIVVETPQIPTEMIKPTVQTNAVEQLQIIEQEIGTRENLMMLAKQLDIYGPKAASLSEAQIVDNLRERIAFTRLQLDPAEVGGATVFEISFASKDSELSARVVNTIVSRVLGRNTELRTDRAQDTTQFFDQEVQRLGEELKRLDSAILEFKNTRRDSLPDSLEFRRTQQTNHQERLILLEREEASLRTRRENLLKLAENTGRIGAVGPVTPEQQILQDLQRALTDQLAIFSETSPTIVELRARIAAAEEKVRASRNDPKAGSQLTDFDLQLADIDERVTYISNERGTIRTQLEQLNKAIEATPGNATRLSAMERERDNIQSQYNIAVGKQAEASAGQQVELRAKGGRISVVEPAIAPDYPSSPNKKRLLFFSLLGAGVLGVGLVLLLEFLDKSIRRPQELTQLLGSQPLVTIPYVWTDGEQQKETMNRLWQISTSGAAMVAALVVVWMFSGPLGALLEQFLSRIDSSWVI